MRPRIAAGPALLASLLVALATAATARAQDAPPPEKADARFDSMLAEAKKDPEKADWRALRVAFSGTSRYQPYNVRWRDELNAVRKQIQEEKYKEAEAALDKLMDREGFMRLDGHGVATVLYSRSGQKDKLELHSRFAQGIASTLFVPESGLTIEKPVVVLYIDEEYLFLDALKFKRKRQALREEGGHWFDVMETEPRDGEGGQTFFFNIDMPHKALEKMLGGSRPPKGEK